MKIIYGDNTNEYVTLERADEPAEEGTPLNKATFLKDETAKALELKTTDPTPDDAFLHIAKNPTGDRGININILEELINLKYCKMLEVEQAAINSWLAAGAAKCVVDSYTGNYRYYARIVANTSAFEVRKVNKNTGVMVETSIPMTGTLTFATNPTYVVNNFARIVPVPVRHSDHMIFMYLGGYQYYNSGNSNYYYRGVYGTLCFDATIDSLVAIGQGENTTDGTGSSSGYYAGGWTGLSTRYCSLTISGSYSGFHLATAVRTDSGYIRFWPGYGCYNGSSGTYYGGYVWGMAEGGSAFSSYNSNTWSSFSDYNTYPYYVALYKNDYAHFVYFQNDYKILFSGANTASSTTNASITGVTNYSAIAGMSYESASGAARYRALLYSPDGLSSTYVFVFNNSPYNNCKWTESYSDSIPTYSLWSASTFTSRTPWSLIDLDGHRYLTAGSTMFYDGESGRYAQSILFQATPVQHCTLSTPIPAGTSFAYYQLASSAGFVINAAGNGIIAWNQYGQIYELIFFDSEEPEYRTWTCPEDGVYKVILVGGGAAGGTSFGGGAGYMTLAAIPLTEGETVEYYVGKGGVYNAIVPAPAMTTVFGALAAQPGSGNKGGADGASTASGGGGGGYDLVTYGGQGQNYNSSTTTLTLSTTAATVNTVNVVASKDRNGGQSANSGACTSGDGYGAGGGFCQNGKDGIIVILR